MLTGLPGNEDDDALINDAEQKALDDQFIGIIIGALAALILILTAVVVICVIRHRKNKYNNNSHVKSVEPPHHVTLNLNDLRAMNAPNGKVSQILLLLFKSQFLYFYFYSRTHFIYFKSVFDNFRITRVL